MSLITRGFGSNSKLVVQGFGPPPASAVEEQEEKVFFPGRRSKLYEHLAESLYVRNYSISARLASINGEEVHHIKESRIHVKNDERDSYRVVLDENIHVKKIKY